MILQARMLISQMSIIHYFIKISFLMFLSHIICYATEKQSRQDHADFSMSVVNVFVYFLMFI